MNWKQSLAHELTTQIRMLRVPFFVFALFLFCTKLIPVWLLMIFACLAFQAVFPHLPAGVRDRMAFKWDAWSGQHAVGSKFLKDLKEGLRLMKPFILTALLFAASPLFVVVMAVHYVRGFFKSGKDERKKRVSDGVVFRQNLLKERDDETSFFHSRAFTPTIIGIVGLGVPVAIMLFFYSTLGIDGVLQKTQSFQFKGYGSSLTAASTDPEMYKKPFIGRRPVLHEKLSPPISFPKSDPAKVDLAHFAIYAYIVSLGWCLTVLFLRAYFTFPFNFYSTEYDIEVNREGVRKHPIDGWFAEFIWYFWPEYCAKCYSWNEIKRVDYIEGGFGRLSPLPATLFSKQSIAYQLLNKLASATDGLVDKIGRTEYVAFDTYSDWSNGATRINVKLWELSSDDKARLFYAIRTYAPDLYIKEILQEKLIGSQVMKEPRYTEIWFDLLTSNQERIRQSSLVEGDTLGGGKYTVVEKLGAGGQAAAFLAKTADGTEVVLKEFILTSAEAFGALVESATDFENESSTLSRLKHPKVVKFLDIFAEDRRAYIVLEYVRGNTLRQSVETGGAMSELEAVELAIHMCDILGYLHEQSPPVVHRDFTPENLLKQDDGSLKIVDFSVSSRTGPHKSGDCVGKHSYTPPEQFRSQACPQSDIYALGATLFFLVTGCEPKPISSSDPRDLVPTVSEEFAAIVRKATALDLAERYDSVTWLRLELEELLKVLRAKATVDANAQSDAVVLSLHVEAQPVAIKIPAKKKKSKVKVKAKPHVRSRSAKQAKSRDRKRA